MSPTPDGVTATTAWIVHLTNSVPFKLLAYTLDAA